MTIYATTFNAATKEILTNSIDSGFTSIDQVVEAFNDDGLVHRSRRMFIYEGGNNQRVVYSDFVFRVDPKSING